MPISERIDPKPPFFEKRQHQLETLLGTIERRTLEVQGFFPYSREQLEKVKDAFWIADYAHRNQRRAEKRIVRGKEYRVPYFEHPYAAAMMAARDAQPIEMIIGLLLHDTIENQSPEEVSVRGDAAVTIGLLRDAFGRRVSDFVSRLTNTRWNGVRWVLPEEKEFYSLPGKPKNFPDGLRQEREELYIRRLFAPGNNLEAVGKYYDVLHNGQTIRFLEPDQQARYFRKYRDYFHLLASVVSKELALKGLKALRDADPEVGVRLESLFNKMHETWRDVPFHEAPPHHLFPSIELIKDLPPAGLRRTVIAYWKGLKPEAPFVIEIPKTLNPATARVLLRDLGVQHIEPVESMLHGALRTKGAGHLFVVSFHPERAAELREQFASKLPKLFKKRLREQRLGMEAAERRKNRRPN